MELMKDWVRSLFLILLAITFIEMLLPESSMGKYLRFIFSLVIMGNDPVSGDPADRAAFDAKHLPETAQMRENRLAGFQGSCRHTLCRNPGAYTGCLHNILNKEAKLLLEKWKNDPEKRDKLMKAAAVLIILAVIFLSFDVFTQNRDGRKQIIDSDGGTETELCSILSDIDGVGAVDVMLQYGEKDQVAGVIVTAEGAGNPVVKTT